MKTELEAFREFNGLNTDPRIKPEDCFDADHRLWTDAAFRREQIERLRLYDPVIATSFDTARTNNLDRQWAIV